MSEPLKIKGIVVKASPLGDNDKMLTVLTREAGVISVCARGVKSLKNKNAQGVMPLCYSDFVLKPTGEVYSLMSADVVESFYNLRENMEALSYGVYFAQLAAYVVGKGNSADDEMRLLLNSLYILAKSPERCFVLCAAFEVKMCEYAGLAPYMDFCECGENGMYFDVSKGECVCSLHRTETAKKISENAKAVIEYVQNAELKEALFFHTPKSVATEVSDIIESFLKHQLGSLPRSLDYIKKVIY